ncbi:Fur-regulated basic protein FbpA [Priestia flexa]|uniref:Fur-regulated basic protein FbpA n=1 Tax=Priestia flexa TaxID=86664 RepID=UPI001CFE22BF|nr:Fur-regulated basic protein FbpA [Priestia flexa]
MEVLNEIVLKRREHLSQELMKYGYFKAEDGRQLYELTLAELESTHITVKCKFASQLEEGE